MDALNFIKKFHKKYLDENKIDNNVFDEKGYNYEYYYNIYCITDILENNKYKSDKNWFICKNIDFKINIIYLSLHFNKYIYIHIPHNIIINYNFNKINTISCKNLIINNEMKNLHLIDSFKSVIINNKINLSSIVLTNIKSLLVFNYPVLNNICISDNIEVKAEELELIELTIINNTNQKLIFYFSNNNYNFKKYDIIKPLILEPYTKNIITKNILISKLLK